MGAINDLLKNDHDGRIRHAILRGVTVLTLLLATVIVLFVAGVLWRLFTGADMEAWGIRVWNKAEATRTAPPSPTTPSPPLGPVPFDVKDIATNTGWVALGAIDNSACIQISREAFDRGGYTDTQTLTQTDGSAIGHIGYRIEDGRKVLALTRCLSIGGYVAVFTIASSAALPSSRLAVEGLMASLSARERGPMPVPLSTVSTSTGWFGLEGGTLQSCVQASQETVGSRLQLSDVAPTKRSDGTVTGHRANRREKNAAIAALVTGCSEINGFVMLQWTVFGQDQPVRELADRAQRELAAVSRNANVFRSIGAIGRLSQAAFVIPLKAPNVDDCQTSVQEALGAMKAKSIDRQRGTTFAQLETAQVVAVCVPHEGASAVTGAISGFVASEANALRDGFSNALAASKR